VVKFNYISDRSASIQDGQCYWKQKCHGMSIYSIYFTQERLTFKLYDHLKISYTYIYIWLVQLLLFSYLQQQVTMWSPNLVVITNVWFLIQLLFKWNSSEVWRLSVIIWNFYNNVRIKNIFLGQKFIWFICQYPIKKNIIICLGYIQS
jgi:hypothetical protein